MSKKALTLIITAVAFGFVAIAVYAATNTSSTPIDNTSISCAKVCAMNCSKICAKDCGNCDKYEDCNCKCKDCDGDCENCDFNCQNCDGDCENCDKDCCANYKNSEGCNKQCKSSGDGLCSFLTEEMGSCPKSQECGGCDSH